MTIYTSPRGREVILASYDARLAALPLRIESSEVHTEIGPTHVLVAGPPAGSPLLVLHGANGDAVQMAGAFGWLARRHRVVFVDVPGEPNPSSEVRPDRADASLGHWMEQLLDGLGLRSVAMLGMSGGGYVVMRCAATIPDRIERAVLIVPEGFVPIGDLPEPTAANARAFVEAITAPDAGLPAQAIDGMATLLGTIFEHVAEPMNLGPLLTKEELARFESPVLVFAGGRDAIFPGEPLLSRAREVIPTVIDAVLVRDANHANVAWFTGAVADAITKFLDAP